jgi:hypothetical protein
MPIDLPLGVFRFQGTLLNVAQYLQRTVTLSISKQEWQIGIAAEPFTGYAG